MIERLYIERVGGGIYDVVCNSLSTMVCVDDVEETLYGDTSHHFYKLVNEDDVAGPRIGYKPVDMLAIAYGGDVRIVPAFQLTRAVARLMEAVE